MSNQQRTEWMRWCILRAAKEGGSYGVNFEMIIAVVHSEFPHTSEEIDLGVHYLIERELLRQERTPQKRRIYITNHGIDFVEGNIEPHAGIARPQIEML